MNEKYLVRESTDGHELTKELNRLNPKEWQLVSVIVKGNTFSAFLQRIGPSALTGR